MDSVYRGLFREVSPSVVLVQQVGRIDYFSTGSVILNDEEGGSTFILTHSSMLKSHSTVTLSVRFFNGHRQTTTVVLETDTICILKTNFYSKCKPLQFFDGEVDNVRGVALAPASGSSVYNLRGFVTHKSLEAGGDESGTFLEDYEHYFAFACPYGDCLPSGRSRFLMGPVYNMAGMCLGVVMKDLGYKKVIDAKEESFMEVGFNMKICMTASRLQHFLGIMTGDDDWRKGLRLPQPPQN